MKRNKRIFSKYKNLEYIIGDGESLPFRDYTFDKCVSTFVLEHFLNDIRALKEMNRILKPGGILILTADSLSYPKADKDFIKKINDNVNNYTKQNLEEKLKKSGFEIVECRYFVNSPISYFFFRLTTINNVFLVLTTFAYPLCFLSDRLFGVSEGGMYIACKAKKIRHMRA